MTEAMKTEDLRRLTVEQRLDLMDRIWDTLVDDDAEITVPPEVIDEMQRRAQELRDHPERGISHEEMMKRLRKLS